MANKQRVLMIMGFALIGVGLLALVPLYYRDLPTGNKDILSMAIGVVLGWGSSAVTYYFGNSDNTPKT